MFSHPTIATCGVTEAEAVALHGAERVKVYTSTFTNMYYGTFPSEREDAATGQKVAVSKPKTAMKLVTLLPKQTVLGIHMIGEYHYYFHAMWVW